MVPTCSVRIPRVPTYSLYLTKNNIVYKSVTFYGVAFQPSSTIVSSLNDTRQVFLPALRAPPFSLATTRGIVIYFLFLRVLRCFSSPGSPCITMNSLCNNLPLGKLSSLIRISAGHWIFAPHRSFSQLVTSFFGAMYLGILRMLFVA